MSTLAPPSAIDAPPTERQPSYVDQQLHACMRALRADVRTIPRAKLSLERAEARLRFILRVVDTWNTYHARRARQLIALGQLEAADSACWMLFDVDLRRELLRQCQTDTTNDAAAERVAENALLGREVL
jgi:hypothetical protein